MHCPLFSWIISFSKSLFGCYFRHLPVIIKMNTVSYIIYDNLNSWIRGTYKVHEN